MKAKEIAALVQPEGQGKSTFNAYKRTLKELPNFTDEQLAQLGFEVWDTAYQRADKIVGEDE